jgi:hypothetical protein
MLRLSENRSYCVPIILRALDIVELLQRSKSPLRTNEISDRTGVSLSTTYRILRTLLQRGYLCQNLQGQFSVKNAGHSAIMSIETHEIPFLRSELQDHDANLSGGEVVEFTDAVVRNRKHSGSVGRPPGGKRRME